MVSFQIQNSISRQHGHFLHSSTKYSTIRLEKRRIDCRKLFKTSEHFERVESALACEASEKINSHEFKFKFDCENEIVHGKNRASADVISGVTRQHQADRNAALSVF